MARAAKKRKGFAATMKLGGVSNLGSKEPPIVPLNGVVCMLSTVVLLSTAFLCVLRYI